MKMKTVYFLAILLSLTSYTSTMNAQNWQTPIIEGYERVTDFPDAKIQPDPAKEYKILFHITSANEREGVNAGLWKIARLINLMGLRNVPKENIHLVAVISRSATTLALSGEAALEKTEKENPNLNLLKKLKDYGVEIEVCGQAVAKHHFDAEKDLNQFIVLTLSALIDITTYQMQGYVLMF